MAKDAAGKVHFEDVQGKATTSTDAPRYSIENPPAVAPVETASVRNARVGEKTVRIHALGQSPLPTNFCGIRPWTRTCRRMHARTQNENTTISIAHIKIQRESTFYMRRLMRLRLVRTVCTQVVFV